MNYYIKIVLCNKDKFFTDIRRTLTFPIFKRYLEKRLIIFTNPAKLMILQLYTCFQNNVFDICITI